MKYIKILSALAVLAAPMTPLAQVQNPYGAAITVNDKVITNYEVFQRRLLLQLFGTPGNLQEAAQERLIEERLYLQAGEEIGVIPNEDQIRVGMDEFSGRANLTTEQLLKILESRGIAPQSYHDFIRAGLTWRNVVRARFVQQTNVTDDDIDAALSFQSGPGQLDFLLSEMIIAGGTSAGESAPDLAARLSRSIKSQSAFASAARKYSASPSSRVGGRLDWVPSRALPPNVVAQLLALKPGQVTGPISLNGNMALFQLRSSRKGKGAASEPDVLSYTTIAMPSLKDAKTTAAKARVLRSSVDTCLDMRAAAEKVGENTFDEGAGTTAEIPSNIAIALANLDPKETTTYVRADGKTGVVMLCTRSPAQVEGEREALRENLFSQKVANLGDGYLQELKGDAFITYK